MLTSKRLPYLVGCGVLLVGGTALVKGGGFFTPLTPSPLMAQTLPTSRISKELLPPGRRPKPSQSQKSRTKPGPALRTGVILKTLINFNGTNGVGPSGLIQAKDGNFYGTTGGGGKGTCTDEYSDVIGCGTVFRLIPTGQLTTLVNFKGNAQGAVNAFPRSLIQSSDGNFYGLTPGGGNDTSWYAYGFGTVFRLTPTGNLTTPVRFGSSAEGVYPSGHLIQASDGNFYGTTSSGGSLTACNGNGCGAVFRLTPAGQLTKLFSFNGTNGSGPGSLIQAKDGNFYGTTGGGGNSDNGTVFRLNRTGKLTTLVHFKGTNGAGPWAPLIQTKDGNFYGTTGQGGNSTICTNGCGTVFRMTSTGKLHTLVNFNFTNGAWPRAGLIQANDGNFYGTTYLGGNSPGGDSHGTVFRLTVP